MKIRAFATRDPLLFYPLSIRLSVFGSSSFCMLSFMQSGSIVGFIPSRGYLASSPPGTDFHESPWIDDARDVGCVIHRVRKP
jgi:hypothetical protein